MHKHAYLIIAHNEFSVLEKLITILDAEYNDFYIHIDKKVKDYDFERLKKIVNKSQIYISKKRINVHWGGYSQIETELLLMQQCMKKKYSYVHLLSGVDLPIKNKKYIYDFFEENRNKNFLKIAKGTSYSIEMTKYYVFFCENNRQARWAKFLQKKMLRIQEILGIERKTSKVHMIKSANWFSLTQETVEFLLTKKEKIRKTFRYSICGDELFIGTFLYGTKFYDAIDSQYGNLRYTIWEKGKNNPKVLTIHEWDDLMQSDKLFARKFSEKEDKEIIDKLYKELRGK